MSGKPRLNKHSGAEMNTNGLSAAHVTSSEDREMSVDVRADAKLRADMTTCRGRMGTRDEGCDERACVAMALGASCR